MWCSGFQEVKYFANVDVVGVKVYLENLRGLWSR